MASGMAYKYIPSTPLDVYLFGSFMVYHRVCEIESATIRDLMWGLHSYASQFVPLWKRRGMPSGARESATIYNRV
jgi:hypothetical protein